MLSMLVLSFMNTMTADLDVYRDHFNQTADDIGKTSGKNLDSNVR